MTDRIRKVQYYYTTTANQPREGARVLAALREHGVDLLAFHAFPEGNESQLDFVPADGSKLVEAAKKAGIELSGPKAAFLVEGENRPGACADILTRLGEAKINVTAMDAVVAGQGRYGALFWVKPGDVDKAAKALGAK